MSNKFLPVYAVVIITHGDHAFVKYDPKTRFYGMLGKKIEVDDTLTPEQAILLESQKVTRIPFNSDWVKYVGTSYHKKELVPGGEKQSKFIVTHYWIDTSPFDVEIIIEDGWCKVLLDMLAQNNDNNVYYCDQLAAQKVIEHKKIPKELTFDISINRPYAM